MKKLEHFNFWCQKVLPLVYDDSLSYYEVLCKVVEAINSIIGDSNSIISNIDELQRELAEVRGAEDWEPAEVLLERIKAEKAGNGKKGQQESEQLKSIIQDNKGIIQQATLQAFEQIDK